MSVRAMISELDERFIAGKVARLHDEARLSFPLRSNTVNSLAEFTDVISRYTQHHYDRCVARGLSRVQAAGKAKEILDRALHRQGGDQWSALADAKDGTNGGMRAVLDIICDSLKEEAIEYHIRDVFDRYLPAAVEDWQGRKRMVAAFLAYCEPVLPGIDPSDPSRYTKDIEPIVRSLLRGLRQMSSIFRRL